jgi:hypothetical protein
MASSIGPHGKYRIKIGGIESPDCYLCPGGPVREAIYTDDVTPCMVGPYFYICQTCHSIVPAEQVKHD